jgi:hypothetical protein
MFGLRNKLILCPYSTNSKDPLPPRRVIIPQGDISFSKDGDFARVSINTDAEQHVRWHEYTIDTGLGCLTSNTTLLSKLYLCYLHALTSHCLPDPLLGQTGTEEALCILRSAACRSFQRLKVQEAMLLELIGKLSPNRSYSTRFTTSVKWNDLAALSQHDDFCQAVSSILDHAYALEALYHPPAVFNTSDRNKTLLNRAACRNKLYYPTDLHISKQSPSLDDIEYMSRDVCSHEIAGHVAYQTSWSILNERPSLDPQTPELWDLMNSWDSLGPAGSKISLRYSRYWLKFDAARDWLAIYDLCRKSANRSRRDLKIELSFSFSAAAYGRAKGSNITHFLIIFALDERFRNLNPPSDPSYALSQGVNPDGTHLERIISGSAFGSSAATCSESSGITISILNHWPDYESVYYRNQLFNRSRRNRRVKKYLQPLSRNFRLKEHVLQLQKILQHYGNVSINTVTYHFSPQFTTGHSTLPSYSLLDLLTSLTNVPSADTGPSQRCAIPSTEATKTATSNADSGSLETLIEELQHSRRPLLKHYGEELKKSHCELLGKSTLRFPGGAVPSHEDLLLYHQDCSRSKSKIFSEISAALAPSRNVEETIYVTGLWPRITPRSILRQLAKDRINMLSNQWKFVIVRYAISFLKYLQSLRMLELSSRRNQEELIQETEAIRHNVLAESTPDWLLVQVRSFLC